MTDDVHHFHVPLSNSMYVFVSICDVGFPPDNGLRSGIMVGGIIAPAEGILYYVHFSVLK